MTRWLYVYTTYVTNERTKKKNDRTEEQGNERTDEPGSSKRRHHEFFDFSSTPPLPRPSVPFQCSKCCYKYCLNKTPCRFFLQETGS